MPLSTAERDRLREIKTFPSLIKYLRDELEWPIESDDFEEISFDYTAEELGIDAKTAAKIQEIKQLRPLSTNQPWGIFFLKFEPKSLPVLALRRILGRLVVKKRASANKSDRAAWEKHDLLFISNYGEGDQRQITFAHFTDNGHHGDLPTLKVLGWDQEDTALHLDHVQVELHQHLRWPENPADLSAWRKRWSGAFELKHREVIATSRQLALRLADLARDIRKRANAAMRIETDKGPLRSLMKAFQHALIHDLKEDDFADMYAQTISYGLLSARVSRPAGMTANDLSDMVPPQTNPFLKELLETFLNIGGRKWSAEKGKLAGIDFDELGINDVVDTLRAANMEAVLRDFGNRNPTEDPVIHFYELFLKEYDAKKRMQRGVFYTPRPVVSYIVRSVHELLQAEFGLTDGLADTSTWAAMLMKHDGLKLPEVEHVDPKTRKVSKKPINPGEHFVQILDPACGTGTFLVEVIDVIYNHLRSKWTKEGHGELWINQKWNEYVPKHLLPRLHGYELMMAPYAIAHMKIGLKLFETGYKFGSGERARIYLTNALEPAQDFSDTFEQMAPALAHEAKAVNYVKRHQRFTVMVGNPPYSIRSGNLTDDARLLVEPFKFIEGHRIVERGALQLEKNLNDDYVKFFGLIHTAFSGESVGVVGLITNHAYLDNPTFRGFRWNMLRRFPKVRILDLHGNSKKKEQVPDSGANDNVFDIQQGVAITLLIRRARNGSLNDVRLADQWGTRDEKYHALRDATFEFREAEVAPPWYRFTVQDASVSAEFNSYVSLADAMPLTSSGIKTHRDAFVIDFDNALLQRRVEKFRSGIPDTDLVEEFGLADTHGWALSEGRRKIRARPNWRDAFRLFLYRPFDVRHIYYHADLVELPRVECMQHLLGGQNLALLATRQVTSPPFNHVLVTRLVNEMKTCSHDRGTNCFPLYLNNASGNIQYGDGARPNFAVGFIRAIATALSMSPESVRAGEVFSYSYAVFHSPVYRERYAEFLKTEFPRIPLPGNAELFREMSRAGAELVALHLMESPRLEKPITAYTGPAEPEVEKVSYANGTVWLDKKQTCGFAGVPESVWNFHIGGYQVCQKWLKDRKGRTLSKDDIAHYGRIVVALSETIRLMKEIDETIETHGGWPGAFVTNKPEDAK